MTARIRGNPHRFEAVAADVASFALRAETAFVTIVGLVTAVTSDRQAGGRRGLCMAGIATEPGMAAGQHEARAVMVETCPRPARGLVARLASSRGTEPALVRDVGMAAGTGDSR